MTWAPQEVQKSVYQVLSSDATLTGLVSGVFDGQGGVPEKQLFPYVTIGEFPMLDRSNHTTRGYQTQLSIHVWYQENGRGRKVVQLIQKEIDRILHDQNICVDGWNIISLRAIFTDAIIDIDNVTLHGIQRFNLLIGET